jgi:hypothetical protein
VEPSIVEMGVMAKGAPLRLQGALADGSQAAIVIRGGDTEETFNRKRRAGPIWINSGKVRIGGVPSVLLVFTSAPLPALLSRAEIDRAGLDEEAVKSAMRIVPDDAPSRVRDDYLSLKRDEGRYAFVSSAIHVEPGADGRTRYRLEVPWPIVAPPGWYRVTVYECRNRVVTGQAAARFEVTEVGVAATLRGLAASRALLYGIVAVATMMTLGFGIDRLVATLRRSRYRGARPGKRAPDDFVVH